MPGGWNGYVEEHSEEGEGSFSEDAGGPTMPTNFVQGPLPLYPHSRHRMLLYPQCLGPALETLQS